MIIPTKQQLAKLPRWAQMFIDELREFGMLQQALRWTDHVPRDLPHPQPGSGGREMTKGWDYCASMDGGRVDKACSTCIHHGSGWERTTSQQPKDLYSTKLMALQGLRHELEFKYAKVLANLDTQIREETAKELAAELPK